GAPLSADTTSAASLTAFRRPAASSSAEVALAPPETPRIQPPTLTREVTLKTRNMFRKRSGRPRSETSSAGLTMSATAPTYSERLASVSLPALPATPLITHEPPPRVRSPPTRATRLITDEPPARPPVKKYQGISGCQTGSFSTGRP